MNYQETIKYIEQVENFSVNSSNERMTFIMNELGNPQNKLHFIHVAGTNGKGSCCAYLSSILKDAGYKVGSYTSPHLIKYEERISINGKAINEKDLIRISEKVKKITDKMKSKPSVFEKLTAIGFTYFCEKKCDVVVLEVGLGGRLDATNIINNPDLCIIMNIGLEHTEILGDTLEKIAYEKAGIIKNGSDVVVYNNKKKVIDVIKEIAKNNKANILITKFNKLVIKKEGLKGQVFDYDDLKNIKISLLGKHQFNNAAVAIDASLMLKNKGYNISIKNIRNGLKSATWDARLSLLNKKPLFLLDGAHNPQCAEALKKSLPKLLNNKKAIILCGVLKDKDYDSLLKMLIPFAKEFVCITPNSYRALKAEELTKVLIKKKQKATAASSIEKGIEISLDKAGKNGIVIALGSLYLAGEISSTFSTVLNKWKERNS